ncbi:MAG: type II toxin-antitoxin system RelE/ParE family toxin [Rhizobiaceae bacterium]|nr:type II toxin-antitoxin system RelE/ParE family toxin [Rhizobiaceae bacterium]
MKQRDIIFAPEARADLLNLYEWISAKVSPEIAMTYIERIERYCNGFDIASERGDARDDVRTGLRVIGFERRVTIAFMVSYQTVTILRLFYGGQNWEEDL